MLMTRAAVPLLLQVVGPQVGLAQAQSRALAEASELERVGRHAEAASRYRAILRTDAASVPALLGLERVYTSLERLDSLAPLVRTALARDSLDQTIRSLELRVWYALGRADSVTAAARRWIALAPRSPDPYREWAFTVAQRGDLAGAQRVLAEGASRLGDAALSQELAQLTTLAGEWTEAARQWVAVVRRNPALLASATGSLTRAPMVARDEMLGALLGARSDSTSRRMAADLLAGWGRADEAWPLLDATLPPEPQAAVALLQRFVERAAGTRSRRGALVRGYALERLATLMDPAAAERVRLQAAQAYADAGDLGSAQRMLEAAGPAVAAGGAVGPAMVSLIRALAEQGSVEEAERRLRAWSDRLGGEDRETLREAVAWAWTRRGDLNRAEAVLAPDSGIAATALRGWIALYRGDLSQAREHLRAAGPYTGSREEATRRLSLLVLVERIGADRLPEFGRAMLSLARGDTAQALGQLEAAARTLTPHGGRADGRTGGQADVLAFAGEVALARRDYQRAEDLLVRALAADSVGPSAPAAELALARVQAETGRTEVAIQRLEHLILAHPQSAMVPQARRLRDRLRGVVPE
jgi:tetratricopeptide (TPR) repeat protein